MFGWGVLFNLGMEFDNLTIPFGWPLIWGTVTGLTYWIIKGPQKTLSNREEYQLKNKGRQKFIAYSIATFPMIVAPFIQFWLWNTERITSGTLGGLLLDLLELGSLP